MQNVMKDTDRRNFLRTSAALTLGFGLTSLPSSAAAPIDKSEYVIGPVEGYSTHIGTLVSMMNYNRQTIIRTVKDLSVEQLDFLIDPQANTIGALIMHLGATEKFYQINTFEGRQEFNDAEMKVWGDAMELGDQGRKNIKGKAANHYLDMIAEVRQKTMEEFKKKDDKWLLAIDPEWSKEKPLNTYWKWFHVCEHESNHRGQMTWIKKRLPGAKADGKE